jgi:protein phosphatase
LKPDELAQYYVTSLSHAGMSGKNNEDRCRVARFEFGRKRRPALCAVVADGIGGHRAGEIAAELAIEHLIENLRTSRASQPAEALKTAMIQASEAILHASQTNAQWAGMGSTCACAFILNQRLYTATAGDSRIYLLRQGQIYQLNRDHTWIQEAIDHGLLTPEEARTHPQAHVIRRYLGSPNGLTPDTRLFLSNKENDAQAEANQGMRLYPGDQIVLCSDGLTDLVNDGEILLTLQRRPLEFGLQELVRMANQRGGHDNITIVALQAPSRLTSRRWVVWKTALASSLVLILLGIISWLTLEGDISLFKLKTATPALLLSPPAVLQETVFLSPLSSQPPIGENAPLLSTPFPTLPPQAATPFFATPKAVLPTNTYTPWPTNTPSPP